MPRESTRSSRRCRSTIPALGDTPALARTEGRLPPPPRGRGGLWLGVVAGAAGVGGAAFALLHAFGGPAAHLSTATSTSPAPPAATSLAAPLHARSALVAPTAAAAAPLPAGCPTAIPKCP